MNDFRHFSYATDDIAMKRQPNSRNQRFSRHQNKDRLRQERHTVERERVADRSPRASERASRVIERSPRRFV